VQALSSTDKSVSEPKAGHGPLTTGKAENPATTPFYMCPMHPEVQLASPGNCPRCGMTLEPKTVAVGTADEDGTALRDMTRRFWIGAALASPVFILAMAHMIPFVAGAAMSLSSVSVITNAFRLRTTG